MLTPLLENWKAFPKDNHGALQTMIKRLRLTIFPDGEFVIRYHEVAYEMFFINKGIVRVTSADGIEFATLR